ATDKFGIAFDDAVSVYGKAATMPGIETVGLATHIGSQILRLAPYRDAVVLLASIILVKQTPFEPFVVLDAAMNDLVRPSMYDAWHGIVPVSATDAVAPGSPATIVGPV